MLDYHQVTINNDNDTTKTDIYTTIDDYQQSMKICTNMHQQTEEQLIIVLSDYRWSNSSSCYDHE